jgi:hypothetical protein
MGEARRKKVRAGIKSEAAQFVAEHVHGLTKLSDAELAESYAEFGKPSPFASPFERFVLEGQRVAIREEERRRKIWNGTSRGVTSHD